MNADDKMHIDALLGLENLGLMNWTDKAQLENYRKVYPNYFVSDLQIDKACDRDAFPNK